MVRVARSIVRRFLQDLGYVGPRTVASTENARRCLGDVSLRSMQVAFPGVLLRYDRTCTDGFFTFIPSEGKITLGPLAEDNVSVKVKSDKQLARVATNLAIGVVGLVVIRLIAQFLPMFHDAGWIVTDKLTVQAGVVIAVDALLLSVLVRFATEIRAYLLLRFPAISSFGNMAASLVCLVITVIAYTDFKPVTQAWPDVSNIYLWTFFAIAVAFLITIVVLLFRERDSIAAMILRQPMPSRPPQQHADAEHSAEAAAGR